MSIIRFNIRVYGLLLSEGRVLAADELIDWVCAAFDSAQEPYLAIHQNVA